MLRTTAGNQCVDAQLGEGVNGQFFLSTWSRLSFVDAGNGTATLAGTPTAASVDTYSVVAWATNPFGAANTAITIRVVAAPVPVTPSPASGSSSGTPATGGAPESGEFSTSATDDELRSDDDEEQELGDIPTLATDDPAANGAAGEGGDEGGSASDLLLPALLVLLALLGGGVLATVLALRARARA